MKTKTFLFALGILSVTAGTLNAQNRTYGWNVQQVSTTAWNSQDGIPYVEVPGANLGATSFQLLDGSKIAFLSNATNEIIITDKTSGKVINKFPVLFAPRDFVFDKGFFHVLNESYVFVYNENGAEVNNFQIPASCLGVERLAHFNGATYLLLPSGNSFKIESGGNAVAEETQGWITSSGNFISTKLNGRNSYSATIITSGGMKFEKTFSTNKNTAGVYVVGSTATRIYLDVQEFISESPISVERKLISVELNANGLGNIISSVKMPDCYYVLSNKELYAAADGAVFNMVTSPQGIFIFSLAETKSDKAKEYPASVTSVKYHFNDHLVQVDEK